MKQPGVHAFYSAKDLTAEQNRVGPIIQDEELFISKTVTSQGQSLGAIAADTQAIAQRAAKLVKVVYDELPFIITIEDAIKHNSYLPGFPKTETVGDIKKTLKEADHVVAGEVRLGDQEHFYLETHSCLAALKDGDELEVFSSTQQPPEVAKGIASVLGPPNLRAVCRTKRIGGGFGGKETRCSVVEFPVPLAAYRLGRPVRMMLDRDEDMMITGGRHSFLFKYKVGFKSDGKFTGWDVKAYNNAGYSFEYSFLVMEKAIYSIQNAYNFEHFRAETGVMTNLTSNTAFRGFGSPQSMLVAEQIIRLCKSMRSPMVKS